LSSEGPARPVTTRQVGPWARCALGLSVTPCAVLVAGRLLPSLHVNPFLGDCIAFAGAATFPILGLAVTATAEVSLAAALSIAAPAALTLLALFWRQPAPSLTLLLVDSALVALAWALGTSLGRRVQHPAHLFPACVVAACADLVSLLSPEGPSHAILANERALSVLAVGFPVPGTRAMSPALGVGDLLFMALVFGVARAHGLPYVRSILLCLLGTALAGAAAAWQGVAVPALVPIAAVIVLGLPAIRELRRADRSAAWIAMLIASSIAIATLARGFLLGH
jgi:hypothetical protein